MDSSPGEVTLALQRWKAGEAAAYDRLVALLYDELKRSAHAVRGRFGGDRSPIETTALLHETYVRLARSTPGGIENREHFLAAACRAMRHLLVDELRRRGRAKRGGGAGESPLPDELPAPAGVSPELLLDLDTAIENLGRERPRLQRVLECRIFGGLSDDEIAVALGVSGRTVHREWIKARAWLQLQLGDWSSAESG